VLIPLRPALEVNRPCHGRHDLALDSFPPLEVFVVRLVLVLAWAIAALCFAPWRGRRNTGEDRGPGELDPGFT
jgi:hypothetical protein